MDIKLTATANLFMKRAYETLQYKMPNDKIDAKMLHDQIHHEVRTALAREAPDDEQHIVKEAEAFLNRSRWKYQVRIVEHASDGQELLCLSHKVNTNEEAVAFLKLHGFSLQIISRRWFRKVTPGKDGAYEAAYVECI